MTPAHGHTRNANLTNSKLIYPANFERTGRRRDFDFAQTLDFPHRR